MTAVIINLRGVKIGLAGSCSVNRGGTAGLFVTCDRTEVAVVEPLVGATEPPAELPVGRGGLTLAEVTVEPRFLADLGFPADLGFCCG